MPKARKSFINRGLRRLKGLFSHKNAQKAQRNEEQIDRITGLTEIIEVFGRVKTVLFGRKDAQNVQKLA